MDVDTVFIFEYITSPYPKERHGLNLVGARRLDDKYEEFSEDELDEKATHLKLPRPERWHNLTSWSDIKRILNESPLEFEGFILRNKENGSRIKFEREIYNQERPYNIFVRWKYKMLTGDENKEVINKIEESFKTRVAFLSKQIKAWRIMFDCYPTGSGRNVKRNALRVSNEPGWAQKFILQFTEEEDYSKEAICNEMLKLPDDQLRKILGVP
jgi:hypothetical protein